MQEEDGACQLALRLVTTDRTLRHAVDAARREGLDEVEGLVPTACRSEGCLIVDAERMGQNKRMGD